tara:strand:- start:11556 stop:12311 length:756 start_codon:yes stop_codon:yes gene_type:complete
MNEMSDSELLRYNRHIMMPELDIVGQQKLRGAHILMMGLGGLGSPVALYLAAAGVGQLTLVDFDEVDLSNLQRQIAHGTNDVGTLKVTSAARSITEINPHCRTVEISEQLSDASLTGLLTEVDLVVDGTDNFKTRLMVNDACVRTQTALVSGAAIRLEGQIMAYDPTLSTGPCYRCLYGDASDGAVNCAENGVLATVVGVVGTIMATEAIKMIADLGQNLAGFLLVFDAASMEFRKLKLPRNPDCKACRDH